MLTFGKMTTHSLIVTLKATSKNLNLSYLPISHGMKRWIGECCVVVAGIHVFFVGSLKTLVDCGQDPPQRPTCPCG
jgi:long-chain acyl-CoA synthetase